MTSKRSVLSTPCQTVSRLFLARDLRPVTSDSKLDLLLGASEWNFAAIDRLLRCMSPQVCRFLDAGNNEGLGTLS